MGIILQLSYMCMPPYQRACCPPEKKQTTGIHRDGNIRHQILWKMHYGAGTSLLIMIASRRSYLMLSRLCQNGDRLAGRLATGGDKYMESCINNSSFIPRERWITWMNELVAFHPALCLFYEWSVHIHKWIKGACDVNKLYAWGIHVHISSITIYNKY